MPGTLLHTYLTGLPGHFVPRNEMPRTCDPPERGAISARPFLSIVTRTQGRRMGPFRDVTASLAAQTDTDFEWLVIGHRLSAEERRAVEQEIGDCPAWLRDRTRLIEVADGNRTKPLNAGYAAAAGAYIVSLDDDDMPLGHWVETFHALAASDPGKLLRTVAVRQDVRAVRIMEEDGVRAEGTLENLFAPEFDFLEHLDVNQTPNLAVAFPRGVFHRLGYRFDETLTTTEDWDFLMRAAAVAGVVSSPEITAIYRWWVDSESSRTVHDNDEWDRNFNRVHAKLNAMPLLLPAGLIERLRRAPSPRLEKLQEKLREKFLEKQREKHRVDGLVAEIGIILASKSWRIARLLARLTGRPDVGFGNLEDLPETRLEALRQELFQSTSWRLTEPLRRIRRLLG